MVCWSRRIKEDKSVGPEEGWNIAVGVPSIGTVDGKERWDGRERIEWEYLQVEKKNC